MVTLNSFDETSLGLLSILARTVTRHTVWVASGGLKLPPVHGSRRYSPVLTERYRQSCVVATPADAKGALYASASVRHWIVRLKSTASMAHARSATFHGPTAAPCSATRCPPAPRSTEKLSAPSPPRSQ